MRLSIDGTIVRTLFGRVAALAVTLVGVAACGGGSAPAPTHPPSILRIGFGLSTSPTGANGMSQVYTGIVLDRLVAYGADARGLPSIAERWSVSENGRLIQIDLRKGVLFHNGQAVNATSVRDSLRSRLQGQIGPVFEDVTSIEAAGADRVEIALARRSPLVLEGLDVLVQADGPGLIGSGAWVMDTSLDTTNEVVRLRANDKYYAGRPLLDGIEIRPYASIRSAWADLLRDNVDMLYEVGADAIDSLRPSSATQVFTYARPYVLSVIMNVARPSLKDAALRRRLNAAVDRDALVKDVLHGLGMPARGPIWPSHWAYDRSLPGLHYSPAEASDGLAAPLRLKLTFPDPAFERVVVFLQQQLRQANVEIVPELITLEEFGRRSEAGDFDLLLADAVGGPTLLRPYQFWHSAGIFNWGNFASSEVDAALLSIRTAADDVAFKAGVAAFQRAVINDPPAIFLTWGQRARAVSTRFKVFEESPRDIMTTLRLWRPTGSGRAANPPN